MTVGTEISPILHTFLLLALCATGAAIYCAWKGEMLRLAIAIVILLTSLAAGAGLALTHHNTIRRALEQAEQRGDTGTVGGRRLPPVD